MNNIRSSELKEITEVIGKSGSAAYQKLLIDGYIQDIMELRVEN